MADRRGYIGNAPALVPLNSSQLDSTVQALLGVRKNAFINGNFDLWQRGTSLGSGTGSRYLADRWKNLSSGTTYTASQQAFTLGQTTVPNEPAFFHRAVVTSVAGAGNFCLVNQNIESVRTFANKTITLSFWAKADASKNISVEFSQQFGTGGSPSAGVFGLGVTTIPLTTTFQKFTVTTTLPSLSGKTIGTNGDDLISIAFWFDAGSSFNSRTNSLGQQSGTFDIAQVQVEEGPFATSFERRSVAEELPLAMRYYEKSFLISAVPQQANGVNTGELQGIAGKAGAASQYMRQYFSVRKRAAPSTLTFFNPVAANGQVRDITFGGDCSTTLIQTFSDAGFTVTATGNAGTAVGNLLGIHWTADAEL